MIIFRSLLFVVPVIVFGFNARAQLQLTPKQADSIQHHLLHDPIQDYRQADFQCHQLIIYYKAVGDWCQYIRILSVRSNYQRQLGELVQAIGSIQQAEKAFQRSSCDSNLYAVICFYHALLYQFQKDTLKADSIAKLGIACWKQNEKDNYALAQLYILLGSITKDLGTSSGLLQAALRLSRNHHYTDLELNSLITMGAVYGNNDRYEEADVYFRRALPLARSQKAYKKLADLFQNLAGSSAVAAEQSAFIDSAIYYYRLGKDLLNVATFTENKAFFLFDEGKYKDACLEFIHLIRLKDSVLDIKKVQAVAEMEKRYDAEKAKNENQKLKVEQLAAEVRTLHYKRNQYLLLIGGFSLLFILGILGYRFVIMRRNRNQLADKNIEIEKARQVSDQLLLNILPEEVANELKLKGVSETREFEQVSVLFTDFINFTQISAKLTAAELVEELNQCFKAFDGILEKFRIEKIKTIGDAYMAAGNLPAPIEDAAKNTVMAALEMQQFIIHRGNELKQQGRPSFEMRIGIHMGPVVAGIVGVKKFQYDIWGDTVNTASRMESNGEAGKVNISQSVYQVIAHDPGFSFVNRGEIEAKGKGMIAMYFVEKNRIA